jgi:phospholipid-translocating ATPase
LCSSAASQGVVLESRTKKDMTVSLNTANNLGVSKRNYGILHVFEFSSDRKCMSIVLREEETSTIWLYSKGADDKILANLVKNINNSRVAQSSADVNAFALQGLRTLMFGRRKITPHELIEFEEKYDVARTSTEKRTEKMSALQADFERDIEFLGASGVEDKLQEDVQGTVHRILDGNIKFWMLTGDKVETAKQIAVSCGLFPAHVVVPRKIFESLSSSSTTNHNKNYSSSSSSSLHHPNLIEISGSEGIAKLRNMDANKIQLPAGADEAEKAARIRLNPLSWFSTNVSRQSDGSGLPLLKNARPLTVGGYYSNNEQEENKTSPNTNNNSNPVISGMYLVVEGGPVLEEILKDNLLTTRLIDIAKKCVAVVCARVTPGQKAAIAAKVKEHFASVMVVTTSR